MAPSHLQRGKGWGNDNGLDWFGTLKCLLLPFKNSVGDSQVNGILILMNSTRRIIF